MSTRHRKYLQRIFQLRPSFPYTRASFSDDEIATLNRYGYWFLALEKGWVSPETDPQRRFIDCCAGKLPPVSKFERIWIRYRNCERDEIAERKGREAADASLERSERELEEILGDRAYDAKDWEWEKLAKELDDLKEYREWTEKVRAR